MTRFEVNSAAAFAGAVATMSAKSGRPLALRPAVTAPKRKPLGIRGVERWLRSGTHLI